MVPTHLIEGPEHFLWEAFLFLGPRGFSGSGQCLHKGISTGSTWHLRICQVGHAQPSVSLIFRHVDSRSFRAPRPDRRQQSGARIARQKLNIQSGLRISPTDPSSQCFHAIETRTPICRSVSEATRV